MDVLPSTTYQIPPRLGRGRQLNTIMEEPEHQGKGGGKSDSETDGSDSTVYGRPATWNSKLFVAAPRKQSGLSNLVTAVSPASTEPSPCSSQGESLGSNRGSVRSSVSGLGSENGTVFSDESCPSLASDPTTFATDSSRNSVASSKSSRNRYPALLIPRSSWQSMESPIKELTLGMSPSTKITLSPAVLSKMPLNVPAEAATPSLGSSSSVASESPCIPSLSGPGTPDLRNLDVTGEETWGEPPMTHTLNPLEIALDDDHSILLSPAEAHSATVPPAAGLDAMFSPREAEWGGMVARFPRVPGENTNQLPFGLVSMNKSQQTDENGVFLPDDALMTLHRLTREVSPDEKSEISRFKEMKERSEMSTPSRPRSVDGITPISEQSFSKLSDYSFTQLSIPSPGGFFSSLRGGARHTWCLEKGSRTNSVPTSAAAENFYFNWDNLTKTVETTITCEDTNATEGPPTARQAQFDASVQDPERRRSTGSNETDDLYGAGPATELVPSLDRIEYEEAYQEELKQAAEANLDRTGSWLSAQTSYLSALRESNPVNDPVDYLPSPHPGLQENSLDRSLSIESNIRKTVRFLEEAKAATASTDDPKATSAVSAPESGQTSPDSPPDNKDSIFHSAFEHALAKTSKHRSLDTFVHASARLETIRSSRVALPIKHIDSLLGQHWLAAPQRPKYSGPFNSNPRATGIFERNTEALMFETIEREQCALRSVRAPSWQIDALRSIYSGRLLASPIACERLAKKATLPLDDPSCVGAKRLRVLDFGGEATASWAWHAAHEWPNVKIYTVLTQDQSSSQRPPGVPKPAGPENHRTVSVPHLWQLPFRSNHFDVISARGLHALLKSNPVPGVPEIDEWDLTLKECMRILKPGGCLDFMIMDSGVARAGSRGDALSVEFGFELNRRGYEREAGRSWLRRLKKEGFVGVKRAWVFLPMGRRDEHPDVEFLPAPRPVSEVSTISKIVKQYLNVEAVQGPVGSTQEVADVTGLLGVRMWEEWILKIRRESGREKGRLLEGIDEVLEEGKEKGSGWKVLVGWARKPKGSKRKSGRAEIPIALGVDGGIGSVGSTTPTPTPVPEMEMREIKHESLLSQGSKERASLEVGMIPMMIQS